MYYPTRPAPKPRVPRVSSASGVFALSPLDAPWVVRAFRWHYTTFYFFYPQGEGVPTATTLLLYLEGSLINLPRISSDAHCPSRHALGVYYQPLTSNTELPFDTVPAPLGEIGLCASVRTYASISTRGTYA